MEGVAGARGITGLGDVGRHVKESVSIKGEHPVLATRGGHALRAAGAQRRQGQPRIFRSGQSSGEAGGGDDQWTLLAWPKSGPIMW